MPALLVKQAEAEDQIRNGHLKRVKWAIAFSQASLRCLNANHLLQVKKSIFEFLYGGGRFLPGADARRTLNASMDPMKYTHRYEMERFANGLSVRQLHKVQGRLRESFNSLLSHASPGTLFMRSKRAVFGFSWSTPQSSFVWDVMIHDVVPAAVIALGAHLVGSRITPEHLRRCPLPDCGIIFLASRKPRADRELHCSIQCSREAARRRYQKRNRALIQLKDRDRHKRRYRKKILGRRSID